MSLTPLKPIELPPLSNIIPINNNKILNPNKNQQDTKPKTPTSDISDMISTLETKLRSEFQQQMDQLRELIQTIPNNKQDPVCPSDVNWDGNVDRCRSSDGKFVKTKCCDTNNDTSNNKNNEKVKAPSYYILSLMDKYKHNYVLASEFHNEVNKTLNEVGIPHLSPQQIRIFVNLNGYSIVKMNGQNTYKFIC